jgi:hypothetical protein
MSFTCLLAKPVRVSRSPLEEMIFREKLPASQNRWSRSWRDLVRRPDGLAVVRERGVAGRKIVESAERSRFTRSPAEERLPDARQRREPCRDPAIPLRHWPTVTSGLGASGAPEIPSSRTATR